MLKKLSYVVFIGTMAFSFHSCSLSSRIKKADKQYAIGEYYGAADRYKKVLSRIPAKNKALRARIAFNQAECYRILNYNNAEQIYNLSVRFGYPDSLVYLRRAQVLQRNGKYADAAQNYNIYLQKDPTNKMAINGSKLVAEVEALKAKPTLYKVSKVPAFNARRSYSFSPSFLNADGDVLFFTSNRSFNKKIVQKNSLITGLPNNKIFSVRKNAEGKWEKPLITSSDLNTLPTDDGACAFNSEGTVMYFTRARQLQDSELGTEIYYSNRAGGAWSDAKKLTIFKDSTISVAHPAVSPDGETIYFVSDAPNGFGGKDIWTAKVSNGECTAIRNLGADINTPGDEMFPTVKRDGTLYFSSNGKGGLGGLDIFKAVAGKDQKWSVENVGIPINSNADDFGITFEGNNERGFFSSNRGEVRGYDAIWKFELPVYEFILEGKVLDESANPIPDAVVRMVSNSGMIVRVQTKKDGTYRMKIDKDLNCVLMASARGYLNKEGSLSTVGAKESKIFNLDFRLSTIYKPVQLNNIFYDFGKWTLTPASEAGLKELVKTLNDNPNITMEISAHTDYVGNNESNKTLSERRAKSVVDYLIAAGIKADRLTSVGYGEEKPFVVDATSAQKYPFLKENDILNEDFIKKLSPENQETANQINRRTEFRVLKTTYK
ncbi:MAG: OmpA/MotB domain protein [Bacteroidetes bacterium]|nr:OmpA/MotB domain protein [Bacteroidota bacterium]